MSFDIHTTQDELGLVKFQLMRGTLQNKKNKVGGILWMHADMMQSPL